MNKLEVIKQENKLDFTLISFSLIIDTVSESDYKMYCNKYAKMFYTNLYNKDDKSLDWLNPIHLYIYNGDSKLLRKILKKYGYPVNFYGQQTPIQLCKRMKQGLCFETICIFLLENGLAAEVEFTKEEFQILLKNGSPHCDRLIGQMIRPEDDRTFQTSRLLNSQVAIAQYSSHLHYVKSMKEEHYGKSPKRTRNKTLKKKGGDPTIKVEAVTLPFEFDFSAGSEQSVGLLRVYSSSSSPEFILSDWRFVVKTK